MTNPYDNNRLSAPSHRYTFDGDDHHIQQHKNISYLDDGELDITNDFEMVPVQLAVGRAKLSTFAGNNDDELDRDRPSNERLLLTAFFSFAGFTLAQSVAAFIAGSEAMVGDSAAMAVDALTYLFNLLAERRKSRFEEIWTGTDETDPEKRKRIKARAKRKMILRLEIIPPVISVTTLLGVTGVVLHSSLGLLILDSHRDRTEQGDPNVNLMLGFSLANIVLDFMNVCCFARANKGCGYKTSNVQTKTHSSKHPVTKKNALTPRKYAAVKSGEDSEVDLYSNGEDNLEVNEPRLANDNGEDDEEEANLNMCSAYTHVFADTLRSIAVVVASTLAELVDGVTSEVADAAAAVTVSILIILSLLPLLQGLYRSCSELRGIYAEERDEKLYPAKVSAVVDNNIIA